MTPSLARWWSCVAEMAEISCEKLKFLEKNKKNKYSLEDTSPLERIGGV
jgi:hypothetical protein